MDMWVEGVRIMNKWEQANTYIFRCGCTRAKLPLPAFSPEERQMFKDERELLMLIY